VRVPFTWKVIGWFMVGWSPELPIGEVRRLRYQKSVKSSGAVQDRCERLYGTAKVGDPVLRSAGMKLSLADELL
jgi:hypothetical protein